MKNWLKPLTTKITAAPLSSASALTTDLQRKGQNYRVTNQSTTRKVWVYYLKYVLNYKSSWILAAVIVVSALVLTNTLLNINTANGPTTEFVRYSLIIHIPLFGGVILTTALWSWILFAKTKSDGTFLFESAHQIRRTQGFWLKLSIIFFLVTALMLIVHFLMFISLLANGVSFALTIQLFLIELTATMLELAFFSALFVALAINLSTILSISAIILGALVLLVSPVLANTIRNTGTTNALTWNTSANRVSYAKVYQVDNDAQLVNETTVNYQNPNGLANSNAGPSGNINVPIGAGVVLDGFVNTPYELMLSPLFSNSINQGAIANDASWSMLALEDEAIDKATAPLKSGLTNLMYGYGDANPLTTSYEDSMNFFREYYRPEVLQSLPNGAALANQATTEAWSNQLINEANWATLSFEAGEREIISYLLGLNQKAPLVFYLFRDWAFFVNKYVQFFDDLGASGLPVWVVDFITNLFTNTNVRNNVLNSNVIVSNAELNALYPVLMTTDDTLRANLSDINAMKNLITSIESPIVRLNMNGLYADMPTNTFPFRNTVSSKAAWNKWIDDNSELGNLKSYYQTLRAWALNERPTEAIQVLSFSPNTVDGFGFNNSLNLNLESNLLKNVFYMIALLAVSGSLAYFNWWRYRKIEVK